MNITEDRMVDFIVMLIIFVHFVIMPITMQFLEENFKKKTKGK
jgi:hypothetical protein